MINDSNNNSGLDIIASAMIEDSINIMNKPLITALIINRVTPSIPSMSNNILNTSMQTTINENDYLSTYARKNDNISYSNDFSPTCMLFIYQIL